MEEWTISTGTSPLLHSSVCNDSHQHRCASFLTAPPKEGYVSSASSTCSSTPPSERSTPNASPYSTPEQYHSQPRNQHHLIYITLISKDILLHRHLTLLWPSTTMSNTRRSPRQDLLASYLNTCSRRSTSYNNTRSTITHKY